MSYDVPGIPPVLMSLINGTVKGYSSWGSTVIMCEALNDVATTLNGEPLKPGALNSDHSDSFRNAFLHVWPEAEYSQDWAYISRKFTQGEYMKKTHEHFTTA